MSRDRGKITGVGKKKKKIEVVEIDDDSSDDEGDLDEAPQLIKKEYDYDSSDDEDDVDDVEEENNVGPHEEEVEIETKNGSLPKTPVSPALGRGQRVRNKRTHYIPHSSEFAGSNVEHFQSAGAIGLSYRGYKYHLK